MDTLVKAEKQTAERFEQREAHKTKRGIQELQARPAFYLLGLLQEGRTRSQGQAKRKPSKCPP